MADCPSVVIEVRRRKDGSLDEVVAGDPNGRGVYVHLEKLSDSQYWIGIHHKGYRQVVTIGVKDGQLYANSEMDDEPEVELWRKWEG